MMYTLTDPLSQFPLFPYTTLFRSRHAGDVRSGAGLGETEGADVGHLRIVVRVAEGREKPLVLLRGAHRLDRLGGEAAGHDRSEEHTSELQSRRDLVCRLLLVKNNQ